MNISRPFIRRPVGMTLLAVGLVLIGVVAYRFLPVASLPSIDLPTIRVSASQPGARARASSRATWKGDASSARQRASSSTPAAPRAIAYGGSRIRTPRRSSLPARAFIWCSTDRCFWAGTRSWCRTRRTGA